MLNSTKYSLDVCLIRMHRLLPYRKYILDRRKGGSESSSHQDSSPLLLIRRLPPLKTLGFPFSDEKIRRRYTLHTILPKSKEIDWLGECKGVRAMPLRFFLVSHGDKWLFSREIWLFFRPPARALRRVPCFGGQTGIRSVPLVQWGRQSMWTPTSYCGDFAPSEVLRIRLPRHGTRRLHRSRSVHVSMHPLAPGTSLPNRKGLGH